jgi:hypothetical protein
MSRVRVVVGVLALALLTGGWLAGQEKKDPPTKLRGQLPAGWKKLGLSETQVQQIYKVQMDYDTKVEALQEQINQLRKDEKKDLEKLLTDAQKARLKELKDEK